MISVVKVGMVCKFNIRIMILVVMNFKGLYDFFECFSVNIVVVSFLLSRFDFFLVLYDVRNEEWDRCENIKFNVFGWL